MRDVDLYAKAGEIAYRAMGTHGKDGTRNADEDPLAWWCLTEWIVSLAKEHKRSIEATE